MIFVDKTQVIIHAGDGGDGFSSFRHEKFIDRGGPDGGDGGSGGDVIFMASRNQNTLANFRFQKELKAESGSRGSRSKKHGKSGVDLIAHVPVGTAVLDGDGKLLADLVNDGQQSIIAKGGNGGFGNAHFISSVRQAPRIAEKGEEGEQFMASLELKMIADVGLVGLPNAGKSTLLSVISHARPEIADYPFTTLTPNLGVVDIGKEDSLLFADIPGLIEGAASGKGLGDEFLRHIERTSVLVHMIDVYEKDIVKSYKIIQNELKNYRVNLTKLPQIIALNKAEGLGEDDTDDLIQSIKEVVPKKTEILAVSAKSGQGVDELIRRVNTIVKAEKLKTKRLKSKNKAEVMPILRLTNMDDGWEVSKQPGLFLVTGKKIERFAKRTDFSSPEGVQRLKDIMKKMGITHELARQGAKHGTKIIIAKDRQLRY
ncbi:MAG TPA: GTPase ObgE [Candidatus Saccharimonadales bacterium]|jgi:GTP-binding protein|nr:GTPase ObgE [Candidatus Saccharimonadales bacterium]